MKVNFKLAVVSVVLLVILLFIGVRLFKVSNEAETLKKTLQSYSSLLELKEKKILELESVVRSYEEQVKKLKKEIEELKRERELIKQNVYNMKLEEVVSEFRKMGYSPVVR